MASIVLVGPRACGKTSVGKELALSSGWPFVDADIEFTKRYGAISEFVNAHGQETGWREFRRLEAQLLEEICCNSYGFGIVLAPGGGAVAHGDGEYYRLKNVAVLRRFGHVFYILPYPGLEKSAEVLVARIEKDAASGASRPALIPGKSPLDEMLGVLSARDDLYRKAAHVTLYTCEKSPAGIAADVRARFFSEICPHQPQISSS